MIAQARPTDDQILDTLAEGRSERETAELLGISRGAVRGAKRRRLPPAGSAGAGNRGDEVALLAGAARAFRVTSTGGTRAGRQLGDGYTMAGIPNSSKIMGFIAPDGTPQGRDWRASIFSDAELEHMTASQVFDRLLTASPEVSRGAHDFVRLFNPGHEITALRPGTEDPSDEGEAAIAEIISVIKRHYTSVNVIFAQLAMSLFSRGSMLAEVVLDDTGTRVVDFVVGDPATVQFRRATDPERGAYWQMGQWQGAEWVPLESELIGYVRHDSMPDKPHGRAPIMPALFPALFLMGFLQDLRRVVANAGYNRIALSVDVPALYETAKALSKNGTVNEADFLKFVDEIKASITKDYKALDPGDAIVKDSNVVAENLAGTLTTMNPGAMEGVIVALERMCVKALKSIPLLHGITESTSDANANRQWEMLVQAFKDMQHLAEDLLSRLLGVALQAMGVLAEVRVEFSELRPAEEHRDQLTKQLEIENAATALDLGWLTPSEAAMNAMGFISDAVEETYVNPDGDSKKKGAPVPPAAPPTNQPAEDVVPDASEERAARNVPERKRRAAGRLLRAVAKHRAVSTSADVTSFDEQEAARVFDEAIPALAGILDAVPDRTEAAD